MIIEEDERPSIVEDELNGEEGEWQAGRAVQSLAAITPDQVRSETHREVKQSPHDWES